MLRLLLFPIYLVVFLWKLIFLGAVVLLLWWWLTRRGRARR